MCKQTIAIAQCAPLNPENCELTFQCGRLHHYAAHRETCDEAKGECICFFGTCGRIDNVVRSQPFDLTALSKIRCLPCAGREEKLSDPPHGRDFLETKLLTREAVDEQGMPAYAKILKECWNGANECPYHDLGQSDPSDAGSVKDAADEKRVEDGNGDNNHVTVQSAGNEVVIDKNTNENTYGNDAAGTRTQDAADNFAAARIKQESTSSQGTPNKLDHVPAYIQEAFQNPDKNNEASPNSKPMLGIEASRWAPDDGSRLDTPSEPEKGPRQEAKVPRSTPRRELYNTPNIEPGKSSISHRAEDIKKFLGL